MEMWGFISNDSMSTTRMYIISSIIQYVPGKDNAEGQLTPVNSFTDTHARTIPLQRKLSYKQFALRKDTEADAADNDDSIKRNC